MKYVSEIIKIAIIIFLQVVVFNNLHFLGICYPYIYVLLLITLPVMPRWAELFVGLSVGLIMDICCSSPGINMAACILVAYLRPLMLSHSVQEYERISGEVNAESLGTASFIKIAVLLCLIHSAVIFIMDAWSWSLMPFTILRWIVSTALSLLFILPYGLRKSF